MAEVGENIVENEVKVKEVVTFNENVWVKSMTLIVNLVINFFIILTVFVCLLYATENTFVELHIILCVLGISTAMKIFGPLKGLGSWGYWSHAAALYQFFMWQGIMMMSKYNNWSLFIQPQLKQQIHGVVHIISAILVVAGTAIALKDTTNHFATKHGILGVAAFACCLFSLLNGALSMFGHRRSWSSGWMYTNRFFHYLTGMGSLFLATAALCYGFETKSFKDWTGRGEGVVLALIIINWIITALVALDFWIVMGTKLVNHIKQTYIKRKA